MPGPESRIAISTHLPLPVSPSICLAASGSERLWQLISRSPPSGIACIAFNTMLSMARLSCSSSPITKCDSDPSCILSFMSDLSMFSKANPMAPSTTSATSTRRKSSFMGRVNMSSSLTTLLRLRVPSRIFVTSLSRGSSSSKSLVRSEAKPSIPPSGLRISWATVAAICPSAASLS